MKNFSCEGVAFFFFWKKTKKKQVPVDDFSFSQPSPYVNEWIGAFGGGRLLAVSRQQLSRWKLSVGPMGPRKKIRAQPPWPVPSFLYPPHGCNKDSPVSFTWIFSSNLSFLVKMLGRKLFLSLLAQRSSSWVGSRPHILVVWNRFLSSRENSGTCDVLIGFIFSNFQMIFRVQPNNETALHQRNRCRS